MLEQWICAIRTESLTSILKLFPFLVSDYFYITFIALGYWLNPTNKIFRSLGFLVPLTTSLNCLLKNLFRILRPDIAFHLIPVHDPFGFPSGDVQAATVFWIFISSDKLLLRCIGISLIIAVGFSRIYLGVHSIWDVFGGVVFGLITLYLWQSYGERKILDKHQHNFWILLFITFLVYAAISWDVKAPPMVSVALGCLIGFGLSIRWINNQDVQKQHRIAVSSSILALLLTITILQLIPVIKYSSLTIFISLTLKYAFLTFNIFVLMPYFIRKVFKNF